MYSISLNLKDHACLVVGGGTVAARKIDGLLKEGASVTVVAPRAAPGIEALFCEKKILLQLRPYEPGEAAQYCLVFAATNDPEVNRRVFADADQAKVWANVADDPPLCSFHLPSRVERGALTLSIASGGEAPFAVRRLRQLLERRLGPEWAEWMNAATAFRKKLRQRQFSSGESERLFDIFFETTVDENKLQSRVPTEAEVEAWLMREFDEQNTPGDAVAAPDAKSRPPGFVSLVGGGPGDPGLLTVKGRDRLMRADAVVCDRLAQGVIPCDLPVDVSIHFVGKTAGNHPMPQEEINAMLVRLAKMGKRVVRLKGGDPYVFGRGGEEVSALAEAGIPFEVVPGITAAVAVPAYAGIPVTFRKEAVRVTLITAHEAAKSGGPQIRFDLLAEDPHAVLLGYMGVTNLEHVMRSLLTNGMRPDMPAAIIEQGTTAMQRAVYGTVETIFAKAQEAKIGSPALFVVGPTAAHADTLNWFEGRPLSGQRLVAFHVTPELRETLFLDGAEILCLPNPLSPAARLVMDALPLTGAVFLNAEEVDCLEEERGRGSWVKSPVAWCLSEAAVKRARSLGWPQIHRVQGTDPGLLVHLMRETISGQNLSQNE